MMVVWGSKLYGKVDEIEGLGHVATQFGHLFWIPLIPMKSYFVTHEGSRDFEGMPLGLSMKSVLVAYARAFSIIFFLVGLGAINTLFNPQEVADPEKITTYKAMIVLGFFSIPMFCAAYLRSIRFADYDTARQLSDQLSFDQRLQTYIELCYDKISQEEAEQRMEAIEAGASDSSYVDEDPELAEIYQRYRSARQRRDVPQQAFGSMCQGAAGTQRPFDA